MLARRKQRWAQREKAAFTFQDDQAPSGAMRVEEQENVRLPTPEEAKRYAISRETPLMEIERVYYDDAGGVVRHSRHILMRGSVWQRSYMVSPDHPAEAENSR
ncbi:UTRA domain-containing protein [Streptomyces sp. DSM 44917]|uniref:UTRA domain-containing protein n=1 Tax=Streptomyces boetiae TaxID=3075541 RepID=A0ABU2L2K0_9ACTN|nr:UTRA domain-containing protein [Streptomyces sp. DSM 44917]MDT0305791.1 UTRA domain-containing protein [Streptomyces sp. DSM 44917]